jgi:AraC family ethanolamine operon transcriptional activator
MTSEKRKKQLCARRLMVRQMSFYARQRSFEGIDELTEEVRDWDLDFWQLDGGRCQCGLLQYGARGIHVSEVQYGRAIAQKIGPPSDVFTLGVLASRDMHQIWQGQHVTGDDLVVFPPGGEGSAVTPPGFRAFTCSVSADAMSAVCDTRELESMYATCRATYAMSCDPTALGRLRAKLNSLSDCIYDQSTLFPDAPKIGMMQDLPRLVLAVTATACGSSFPATTKRREMALVRAQAFIAQHVTKDIRMADLHRASGVSPRTLEYAFVERFGLTPKAYLKAYRLSLVRRQLRSADATKTLISEIAGRWGFWHMGSFAADYRKQFGELPSQTLKSVSE